MKLGTGNFRNLDSQSLAADLDLLWIIIMAFCYTNVILLVMFLILFLRSTIHYSQTIAKVTTTVSFKGKINDTS